MKSVYLKFCNAVSISDTSTNSFLEQSCLIFKHISYPVVFIFRLTYIFLFRVHAELEINNKKMSEREDR